ncbi:PEPxxWA-CTERM sorting domain-containing protein [Sphingomonas quercus]|uniref:PEPxxWA-CTERM sorting domain-containing protein n=1 Tax=Sphingomonas quercus TaxID=2842451 RepID=UPI00341431C4
MNTSYAFSGTCLDCGADTSATGVLTLSDYTLGDTLSVGNFVSFVYSSAIYPTLTIDTITSIAGAITGNGANNVAFFGMSGGDNYYFGSAVRAGSWTLTNIFPQDVGINGSWTALDATSAVPEPAAWALMILGFGVAGASLRRRKTVATVAA